MPKLEFPRGYQAGVKRLMEKEVVIVEGVEGITRGTIGYIPKMSNMDMYRAFRHSSKPLKESWLPVSFPTSFLYPIKFHSCYGILPERNGRWVPYAALIIATKEHKRQYQEYLATLPIEIFLRRLSLPLYYHTDGDRGPLISTFVLIPETYTVTHVEGNLRDEPIFSPTPVLVGIGVEERLADGKRKIGLTDETILLNPSTLEIFQTYYTTNDTTLCLGSLDITGRSALLSSVPDIRKLISSTAKDIMKLVSNVVGGLAMSEPDGHPDAHYLLTSERKSGRSRGYFTVKPPEDEEEIIEDGEEHRSLRDDTEEECRTVLRLCGMTMALAEEDENIPAGTPVIVPSFSMRELLAVDSGLVPVEFGVGVSIENLHKCMGIVPSGRGLWVNRSNLLRTPISQNFESRTISVGDMVEVLISEYDGGNTMAGEVGRVVRAGEYGTIAVDFAGELCVLRGAYHDCEDLLPSETGYYYRPSLLRVLDRTREFVRGEMIQIKCDADGEHPFVTGDTGTVLSINYQTGNVAVDFSTNPKVMEENRRLTERIRHGWVLHNCASFGPSVTLREPTGWIFEYNDLSVIPPTKGETL